MEVPLGDYVATPQYSYAASFSDGLATVWFEDENIVNGYDKAFIDVSGNIVFKLNYRGFGAFSSGLAPVAFLQESRTKVGYMDKTGKIAIDPAFDFPNNTKIGMDRFDFSEGVAMVPFEEKFRYIDTSGKFIAESQFSWGETFSEGLAAVRVDNGDVRKWGYINKSGRVVVDVKYDYARQFSEGLAGVEIEGKFGYIDQSGKMVIQPQFSWCGPFSKGLALVKVNEKYGYIDKSGKFVIKPQFTDAFNFRNGLALVYFREHSGTHEKGSYINKKGEVVWENE